MSMTRGGTVPFGHNTNRMEIKVNEEIKDQNEEIVEQNTDKAGNVTEMKIKKRLTAICATARRVRFLI